VHLKSLSPPKRPVQAVPKPVNGQAPAKVEGGVQDDRANETSHDQRNRSTSAPAVSAEVSQVEALKHDVQQTKSTGERVPIAPGPDDRSTEDTAGTAAATAAKVAQWQRLSDSQGNIKLAPDDNTLMNTLFTEITVSEIVALFNRVLAQPGRRTKEYGIVKSGAITDKEQRTNIHQALRRIFSGRLESFTEDNAVVVQAALVTFDRGESGGRGWRDGRGGSQRGRGGRGGGRGRGGNDQRSDRTDTRNADRRVPPKQSWDELGGDFLHFSLYKENKDTMEVISYLARELKIKPQSFQFAGTKDRRAIAVQRVSVYRVHAERLAQVGRTLRASKVGNFEYHRTGLELGELDGNEFLITLRDCQFVYKSSTTIESRNSEFEIKPTVPTDLTHARQLLQEATNSIQQQGFINYYGLQRFGTFSTRTDTVGMKMLQEDYKGAVHDILSFTPEALVASQEDAKDYSSNSTLISNDDKNRAWAINHFLTTNQSHKALDRLPRKFSAERNIIMTLGGRNQLENYLGALQGIQRNLRLMYVHAYQSLVWNFAASERWRSHGSEVLHGDLVLMSEHKEKETGSDNLHRTDNAVVAGTEVDADGEVVINPSSEDKALTSDDRFERARALTAAEALSGMYNIYDVVLPSPGFDIIYPSHMVQFYQDTMGKDKYGGLDPHNMRRHWKDISLSGSYRKLLARPGQKMGFELKEYMDENEQFVKTDMDALNEEKGGFNMKLDRPLGSDGTAITNASALPAIGCATPAKEYEMTDDVETKEMEPQGEAEAGVPREDEQVKKKKLAAILKIRLGSSQYATMALRELMKAGGLQAYKQEYSGGR